MERRARITSEGRVTIPKDVRATLGVGEGGSLLFEVEDGVARMRAPREPVSFADYAGAWREGEGMGMEEINAHIRGSRGHND